MLPDIFPSEEKANNILQNYATTHFTKIKLVCSSFYLLRSVSQSQENKENHPEVKIQMEDYPFLTYPIPMFSPNPTFAEINSSLHNASISAN